MVGESFTLYEKNEIEQFLYRIGLTTMSIKIKDGFVSLSKLSITIVDH